MLFKSPTKIFHDLAEGLERTMFKFRDQNKKEDFFSKKLKSNSTMPQKIASKTRAANLETRQRWWDESTKGLCYAMSMPVEVDVMYDHF